MNTHTAHNVRLIQQQNYQLRQRRNQGFRARAAFTLFALFALFGLVTLSGCSDSPVPSGETSSASNPSAVAADSVSPESLALQQALKNQLSASEQTLKDQLREFDQAIEALLNNPNDENLMAAQAAWKISYTLYNQTRPYLLCRTLNDTTNQDKVVTHFKRTDSFPILPGYIDSLSAWPGGGLVNDISVELTESSVLEQQGFTHESEITTGFQTLEFILFGEAQNPRTPASFSIDLEEQFEDAAQQADAAETAADENAEQSHSESHHASDHPARRRLFLRLVSGLLRSDIDAVMAADVSDAQLEQCAKLSLNRSLKRLQRLHEQTGNQDPAGEYLAEQALTIAQQSLWDGIKPMLQNGSEFLQWLGQKQPNSVEAINAMALTNTPPDEAILTALLEAIQ